MCSYCPQDAYKRAYKRMPGRHSATLDDYKLMLANVAHTTRNIDFSGYTEPLYNPYWFDIFQHTLEQGYAVTLFSTLGNASLDDLDKLSGLALNRIYVHFLDHVIQRHKLAFLIERCREHHLDLVFIYFDEDGRELATDFQNQVGCERWTAHSRAGLVNIGRRYLQGPVSCSEQRHFSNVVLPNGDVHVCCMDFALQYKIGNLLDSPLTVIQHSDAAVAFRETMASARDGICNYCIYAIPAVERATGAEG